MKRISGILCLLQLCAVGLPEAGELDGRAMAEELLVLTDAEKNIVETRLQFKGILAAQLAQVDIPDNVRDRVIAHQLQLLDLAFDELNFQNMKDSYLDIYESVFSAEELAELVAFYKTPVGKAYATKLPVVTKRMTEAAQARVQALLPTIQKRNAEFMNSLECESEAEPARSDRIRILGLKPEGPITPRGEVEVTVKVWADLESTEAGVAMIGFNLDFPASFRMVDSHSLRKGEQEFTFKVKVRPAVWEEGAKFMVLVNMGPKDEGARWIPTAHAQREIEVLP
jgi:hypothetical protein